MQMAAEMGSEALPSVSWRGGEEPRDRFSHVSFFEERDWGRVNTTWRRFLRMSTEDLPFYIRGDTGEDAPTSEKYGVTDLTAIHEAWKAGEGQLTPAQQGKYRRCTYALSIGYAGDIYTGYQQQRGVEGIRTVEDDLDEILGRKCVAAGRTDKSVSAISQVVSFATFDTNVTVESITESFAASPAVQRGDLSLYGVVRVPRKFHPLFGATWRRYVFLFPLNRGSFGVGIDVDADFVNRAFSHLEGRDLPYNGFAHRENRAQGEGSLDICRLFRARASVVSVEEGENPNSAPYALCVELVGTRFLRRMVRILMGTVVRESVLPDEERDEEILLKIAQTGDRYRASFAVPGTGLALCGVGYDLDDLRDYKNVLRTQESKPTPQKPVDPSTETTPSTSARRRKPKRELSDVSNSDDILGSAKIPKEESITISSSDFTFDMVPLSDDWQSFKQELMCADPDLLFFPQRSFQFTSDASENSTQPIILSNDHKSIGGTIWDAEVVLAHYLNAQADWLLQGVNSVVEIGAGTALAAIVASKFHKVPIVVSQDLKDVLDNSSPGLEANGINVCSPGDQSDSPSIRFAPAEWGGSCSEICRQAAGGIKSFELAIMADVLYHVECFPELLQTITELLDLSSPSSASVHRAVVSIELRRADLIPFFRKLIMAFGQSQDVIRHSVHYAVQRDESRITTHLYVMTLEKK